MPAVRDDADVSSRPMSSYLTDWEQHFSAPGESRFGKMLALCRESMLAGFFIVFLTTIALVDALLEPSDRTLDKRVSLRTFFGAFSSIVAHFILTYRKPQILEALHNAHATATELETSLTPEGRVEMVAEAHFGRVILWRRVSVYAVTVTAGVVLTILNDTDTFLNSAIFRAANLVEWWQPWGPATVHFIKWTVTEMFGVTCCIVVLYTLLFLVVVVNRVCAVLLSECGRRLQDFQRNDVLLTVRLHVQVLRSSRALNTAIGLLLPLYLVISVSLSLLSTVAILKLGTNADSFAVACLPYLFIFFVPMCNAGQRMQTATEGLVFSAYSGPWLEEDTPTRRCRLILMAVCRRSETFSRSGVGPLNHPTCRKGLRSWFQFVQVLINVKSN